MPNLTEDQLLDFLRAQVATRTRVPVESLSAQSEFVTLGLQSIDAVLLCGEIEEHFSIEIDPSDIFAHDNLGEFAQSVVERSKG